jgi:uncharacterized protein (DUF1697 family)
VPTFIALLRAVNVGKRQLKMADLRDCLSASGLVDVETYIQTGNVRFSTPMRSPAKVERRVEEALNGGCGFDVPSIIVTPAELRQVYEDARGLPDPGFAAAGQRRYVTFFKAEDAPDEDARARLKAWDEPGEHAVAVGRAVHVWLAHPTQQAKLFGAFKNVLAPGTNRDLKVVRELAERWGA